MSGLETAIRNALDRSDRASPEIRARIYQSARQALEAGLRKQDITDAETVSAQRQRLEATIRAIEEEERVRPREPAPQTTAQPRPEAPRPPQPSAPPPPTRPAAPTPSVVPPQPVVPPRTPPAGLRPVAPVPRAEPVLSVRPDTRDRLVSVADDGHGSDLDHLRAGPADHLGAADPDQPEASASPAGGMDFMPERAAVRRKPRKLFSRLLVFCLVVAALGMGAWWVKNSGLLLTLAERDTSVPNPPARVDAEDYTGDKTAGDDSGGTGLATIDPQNSFSEEWLQVLKPTDSGKIAHGPEAKVENVAESEGPAIRVTSQSSGSGGDVVIEVPQDVLRQIVGKPSTVALTVQATSDTPTQIAVECDFGSLGGCGRHRFDVTRQMSDVLIQLRLDGSQAPAGAGRLVINSDVDGKGTGVNIYAARILPGQ